MLWDSQSCIKGHRSSSCHHTDRPLFEIKKKGRPITQCEECRSLRKDRRLHVKCCCDGRKIPEEENVIQNSQLASGSHKKKTVRKIPTIPTLPNGLKDVISRSPLGPAHTKSKITSLLNPCECYDKLTCKCTSTVSSSGSTEPFPTSSVAAHLSLADPARTNIMDQRKRRKEQKSTEPYPMPIHSCCANKRKHAIRRPGTPSTKVGALFASASTSSSSREPVHPLRISTKFVPLPIFVSQSTAITEPEQEPMELTCLCGAGCLCLGCRRHQGENASDEPGVMCDENCPTCVDNELGPEMPHILRGAGPVGVRLRHCGAHSHFVSGSLLDVAPFAAYEDNTEAGLGGLGWEDAEGSPDPDFLELPSVEERHEADVKVEDDKEKRGLGFQVALPKLPQKAAPMTKNASIVTASARRDGGGCCARRL